MRKQSLLPSGACLAIKSLAVSSPIAAPQASTFRNVPVTGASIPRV
jgi:hypothetical protein